MVKSVRKPSPAPVYAVGVTWVGYTLLFGLRTPGQYLMCIAISVAAYLVFKSIYPGKTVQVEVAEKAPDTGDPALDEVIVQGRDSIKQIRMLNVQIPDAHVTAQLNEIADVTDRIFNQLAQRKDQIRQCRQFLNYYLPTTIKLLQQYVQLQGQNVKDGNIAQAMKRIADMLTNVLSAFRKQLDALFASDVMDITAEIQVMEQMMQAQGLTGENEL